MALAARFSLLHSDLNDFLFAAVGDEPNGMPLNVISALTRLGMDPWEEAARLAALPKALAAESGADDRPIADRSTIDFGYLTVSHRLVELLPMTGKAAPSNRDQTVANDKRYFGALILLLCIALARRCRPPSDDR
jgi:hypothetical protein